MSYCTLADLQKAIPQQTLLWLSNDDSSATTINNVVVDDAVAYAGREINRKIGGRYDLPLQQPSDELVDIAVFIARHYLYARRPEGNDLPDAITRTYNAAMTTLRDIRDGKEQLGIAATGEINTGAAPVATSTRPRLFGADTLRTY